MADHEMTSSVDLGYQTVFHGRKTQQGLKITQQYGPNNTKQAQTNMLGVNILHFSGSQAIDLSETGTSYGSGKSPINRGYSYTRYGQFTFDVDSTTNTVPGTVAAFYANNSSTSDSGTSKGEVGGYGVYISGSQWKSYFDGSVGIGQQGSTVASKTPAYTLDVTGIIRATSNIIAYSDVRDKENIETISGSIDIVKGLRGVRFDWKQEYKDRNSGNMLSRSGETDRRQVGVIAQEVEKVLPELVTEDKETGRKNVSYANMVAVLIEANKEQQKLIEDLQERVKQLESK
jgi:hypothetical protein